MNKHKDKARARRKANRDRAKAWFAEEYPALKVLARLQGVHEVIRWHEFEARPLIERWNLRLLLQMWVEQVTRSINTPNAWRPTEYPPHDWLSWSWYPVMKGQQK